jgi:DNA-binding PadR family transcriptional regulator
MSATPGASDPPFKITPVVFHVLLSLADRDAHGYAIMGEVEERTRGSIRIGPGSLYFTLSRLVDAEMIEETLAPDGDDPEDARRRYYRLTDYGRGILVAELEVLSDIVSSASAQGLLSDASPA